MYLKIHENVQGKVVAACDAGLIGKVFEDKGGYLDLERYKGFYVGDKATDARLKAALKDFGSANLVGKKTVAAALERAVRWYEANGYIAKGRAKQMARAAA